MQEKPTSIRLNEEELKRIDEIAKKERVQRSVILRKAVTQYLQSRDQVPKEDGGISQRVTELEKKVSNLLTRVNILTTQIDKILDRLSDKR